MTSIVVCSSRERHPSSAVLPKRVSSLFSPIEGFLIAGGVFPVQGFRTEDVVCVQTINASEANFWL